MKTLQDRAKDNSILIAAHRGASKAAPENTIAAFKEAIKIGVDMIEIDVQFTKDGEIIVYHNDDIEFENKTVKIAELSYKQIANYEITGTFADKKFNEKIPTFKEVLALSKDKVYIVIEIKPFLTQDKAKDNLKNLCELILENNLQKYVILISFDLDNLIFIKKNYSELFTAAVYFPNSGILPSQYAAKTQCDAFICNITELDEKKNTDALENNIFIGLYGVDSEDALEKALKYDVKVIGSNIPDKMISYLQNLKG